MICLEMKMNNNSHQEKTVKLLNKKMKTCPTETESMLDQKNSSISKSLI